MGTENSQFEISGIQLRESKTQPRVSLSREIGEAQIVHTIFGRAKVRIIRKNDKLYRALWMAAATVVVTAIGIVAWQSWYAAQQTGVEQSADPADAESAQEQVGASASKSVDIAEPPTPPLAKVEAIVPPPTVVNKPVPSQKIAPQQPGSLKETEQPAVKPVAIQPKPVVVKPKPVEPLPESKPKTVPATTPTAATVVTTNQADKPLPTIAAPAKPPKTPVVAAPVVTSPAESSPAATAPLSTPPKTEDTAPVDDKQLSAPINMQND